MLLSEVVMDGRGNGLRANHQLPAGAISAKQFLVPNEEFHSSRTILLTPEENKRLDAVMPVRSNPLL
jgi:hypothetical protein